MSHILKNLQYCLFLLLFACSSGVPAPEVLYKGVTATQYNQPPTRPIAPSRVAPSYYGQQQPYQPVRQAYPPQQQQPQQQQAPQYGGYPAPASRLYNDPYAFQPPAQYPYYDSDYYYVPPTYYGGDNSDLGRH